MQEREAAGVLRDTAAIRTPFYVVDETLLKKIWKFFERYGRAGWMPDSAGTESIFHVFGLPADSSVSVGNRGEQAL